MAKIIKFQFIEHKGSSISSLSAFIPSRSYTFSPQSNMIPFTQWLSSGHGGGKLTTYEPRKVLE